jgi:hypothetical protein
VRLVAIGSFGIKAASMQISLLCCAMGHVGTLPLSSACQESCMPGICSCARSVLVARAARGITSRGDLATRLPTSCHDAEHTHRMPCNAMSVYWP